MEELVSHSLQGNNSHHTAANLQQQQHQFEVDSSLCTRNLTQEELSVLQKGLNFVPVPRKIPFQDLVANFEQTARQISFKNGEEMGDSFRAVMDRELGMDKRRPIPNLSEGQWRAVQSLSQDPSLTILKADKGNRVVVMDSIVYAEKSMALLQDPTTYERVSAIEDLPTSDKVLKGMPMDGLDWKVRHEIGRMNNLLDRLVKSGDLPKTEAKELHQHSGQPPRLYCLPKIHKDGIPMRPIESCLDYYLDNVASRL